MKLDETGIWVIGDVHGEYDILMQLIHKLPINAKICFVGDLIDRGANSCEVIEFIINNNYDCVMGNHEELFLEYAPNKDEFGNDFSMEYSPYYFDKCGGKETIDKMGDNKESPYYDYMEKLPLYMLYPEIKINNH